MNKTYAKLHAILPRKGNKAVVFRRGPSSCVAVIGWDLAKDTFTIPLVACEEVSLRCP